MATRYALQFVDDGRRGYVVTSVTEDDHDTIGSGLFVPEDGQQRSRMATMLIHAAALLVTGGQQAGPEYREAFLRTCGALYDDATSPKPNLRQVVDHDKPD